MPARRRRRLRRVAALLGVLTFALLGATDGSGARGAGVATSSPAPSAAPSPPATTPSACVDDPACAVPCFGAAARDPQHQPCSNPALALSVLPTPAQAELDIGPGCATKELTLTWWVCDFGPLAATRTFALVGDSHAGHWRPALAAVAAAEDWRADAITRAGCPFSKAVALIARPLRGRCVQWNHHVISWLRQHPEVSVVFVSEHAGARVFTPKGQTSFTAREAGYVAAWDALPATVEHIVVIRDTPLNRARTFDCVERAIARRQPAGAVCAIPRARALAPDPALAAALALRSARVQAIDLTQLLCSPTFCFPVIGGVLVHKDIDHLTNAFSTTLGPFVVRALSALMATPAWGVYPSVRAAARTP